MSQRSYKELNQHKPVSILGYPISIGLNLFKYLRLSHNYPKEILTYCLVLKAFDRVNAVHVRVLRNHIYAINYSK